MPLFPPVTIIARLLVGDNNAVDVVEVVVKVVVEVEDVEVEGVDV